MARETVFTIGHSIHTQEYFIALLTRHGITALCDVRSNPYSRVNPQFNREDLKQSLKASGITYFFLGKELGARSEDSSCYENGKVQYSRLAHTVLFRQGLELIEKDMQEYRIALMCAEKEPLDCHRTILVSRHLAAAGIDVQHIHANGTLESHGDALNRLAGMFHLPEYDLFRSPEDVLVEAYERQGERIAFETSPTSEADDGARRRASG